jgi:hypothetical protein
MERGSDVLVALSRIGIAFLELELELVLDSDGDTDPDTDACDKGSRPGSSSSLTVARPARCRTLSGSSQSPS